MMKTWARKTESPCTPKGTCDGDEALSDTKMCDRNE